MPRSTHDSKPKLVALANPASPLAEAYRTLRTNIQFSGIDERVQFLMVASAQSGDGKSTTISNLAITYAQEGKKTLLIDGDLRKPSLHHMFGISNRLGLTNVLVNEHPWNSALRASDIPNLFIMTAGALPPNPSEILASQRMRNLMEELSEEFDMILFDTPPILAVTDGLIISSLCDGVVMVIKSGRTKHALARKLKQSLEHAKARIFGVVLNNVKRKTGEGYYDYYRYGYGYGQKKS
ncbi:CpsD/CapB family tyrosine-protein kinase [Cohnella sp. AR92]|uniref:CpsD/CapB family tyrosine-protein kinase n=1 Tax=Cohnella sp. AR92 TaxID=648716 RepID=UPI000F8EBB52|nr:CpsD/CapB family tyrosine-protein kinase [Cohnella sp. AR92]RUS45282.1 polysaccharide biosynthesis tyrosine autokinase [Cohnella sp. AR92]